MTILSKVCEPDNLESNNYLKFNQKSCHKWDNGQDLVTLKSLYTKGCCLMLKCKPVIGRLCLS